MILQGDTVQLRVYFRTLNNIVVDPTGITLTIYDSTATQLEQFEITEVNKESTGVYFYDYTVPSDKSEFIFEFKGTYNSKPILVRDTLKIQFTK